MTHNRIILRAHAICRRNPVDPPLMQAMDLWAGIAIALFVTGLLLSARMITGDIPL